MRERGLVLPIGAGRMRGVEGRRPRGRNDDKHQQPAPPAVVSGELNLRFSPQRGCRQQGGSSAHIFSED